MVRLRNPEQCPKCGGDSHVTDSRTALMARKRRRECLGCRYRWFTFESLIDPEGIRFKEARRTT